MIVTIINPIDNSEVEVDLNFNVRVVYRNEIKVLIVSANASKVLT